MPVARSETQIPGDIPNQIQRIGHEDDMIYGDLRFETENRRPANGVGVFDRMMRPDHFLNQMAGEASVREDMLITDANALNLRWRAGGNGKEACFVIRPDSKAFSRGVLKDWFDEYKEMEIDSTGYRSACKQIERSPETLNKFENPQARFLDEFHDLFRGASRRGLLIRTTKTNDDESSRTVDAMLPGNYNPISNYELTAAIMNRIQDCYGPVVRGVQVLHDDRAENINYRILFGNPVMREHDADTDPKKILLLMLSFMGTEHGLLDTSLSLGLWRLVCNNGAMRQDLRFCHAGWRRFDSETKFLKRVGSLIGLAGTYGDIMANRLEVLQHEQLVDSPFAMLEALREQDLLDKRTIETAVLGAQESEPHTNWDMLNLLTDSAKTHASMRRRTAAESKSLALAMQPNGFNGVVVNGFDRRAARGDLRNELKFEPSDN